MNRLSIEHRARIIGKLAEGASMRSASRLCDVSINTVSKLLVDVGRACATYQDEHLRNLECRRIRCDEIWSFVGAKAKNAPAKRQGQPGIGDVWTWTGICADTKLVPSWLVGPRDSDAACDFMRDLAGRLKGRPQVTTDGNKVYVQVVEDAFGSDVDYTM